MFGLRLNLSVAELPLVYGVVLKINSATKEFRTVIRFAPGAGSNCIGVACIPNNCWLVKVVILVHCPISPVLVPEKGAPVPLFVADRVVDIPFG